MISDDELRELYLQAGLDPDFYLDQIHKGRELKRQYDEVDHVACPKCGSLKYSSTYVGYIMNYEHPENYKDENAVKCSDCGWKGITHDLVKKH